MTDSRNTSIDRPAYIVTGPTSGIGRATAFELAKHGTVILVGRDRGKLSSVQKEIIHRGHHAFSVVCDIADIASIRRAAAEIVALGLPIAGLLNNAGVMEMKPTQNALGWDTTFATNHLGPFALTEALLPHLPDGANVLFVASAVEDPERKPAKAAGFRGARFISVEASARGEWLPDGATLPGGDAYATSKQCTLVAALALARETPRLHINAIEPGFNPTTSLGHRDASPGIRILTKYIAPLLVPLLLPFMKYLSTSKRAARVITALMINAPGPSGIYYDQDGAPMAGSPPVSDPAFQQCVVAETRAFLARVAG